MDGIGQVFIYDYTNNYLFMCTYHNNVTFRYNGHRYGKDGTLVVASLLIESLNMGYVWSKLNGGLYYGESYADFSRGFKALSLLLIQQQCWSNNK